ncbi:glycosyltransferase [Candidatus Sumerlaeota bacterium]|nr:glycosyltransferase [Candidatus Sumerlaeota bacterium]
MFLSVVIPAFNEEKLLGACLDSVREACGALERGGDFEWEIVVCDNNSTDATAPIARERGARVVFEPHNQIARARNRGAEAARGDWLFFIDADSVLSENLLRDIVETARRGDTVGGGATVRFNDDASDLVRRTVRGWNWISRTFRWAAGSSVWCRTDAFRAIGGFSEEFYISEEIDFSKRLKRYARARKERFVILTAHSVVTSDRKLPLYGMKTHLSFLFHATMRPRRTLRDPKRCQMWYDGRR